MLNKPNIAKIKAAVLFLLNNSSHDLDQYKIAKVIFLADVSHLNKFGRPITYDNYLAMQFGPVPSKTYEFLSQTPEELEIAITKRQGNAHHFIPLSGYDELDLSESDEIELLAALNDVQQASFDELMRFTHKHPAWQEARRNRRNDAPRMDYSLLFEEPDNDQARYIAKFSKQGECTT